MIRLLIAEALPGVGTAGRTIQSQTGASRWQIDDLLVTAGYDADTYHLALSCKSNMQVSRNGLPADFVERAWKQWREPGSPMRRETDVLALVNRGQPATFTPQWSNIVNWCAGADPKLAIARIRATKNHTRIFESIKSPGGTCVATDEETVDSSDISKSFRSTFSSNHHPAAKEPSVNAGGCCRAETAKRRKQSGST